MTKIFIDTNIFLDLYGSNINSLTIFDNDLAKLKGHLIITDQVFDEFIRNRDKRLLELINNFQKNNLKIHTSAIIKTLHDFHEFEEIKSKFARINEKIVKELQEMKQDKEKDPVFTSFLNLYYNSEVTKLNRNDEIIKKAHCRKLLGNPPSGNKQNTIGDEVNWETILSKLNDDLIIITADKTYEEHITFLKNEFELKIKKKLYVDKNISYGLDKIGKASSEELDKFEKEQERKEFTSFITPSQTIAFQSPSLLFDSPRISSLLFDSPRVSSLLFDSPRISSLISIAPTNTHHSLEMPGAHKINKKALKKNATD